jgi:hypothetical protein
MCNKRVEYWVPKGYDYKMLDYKCGSTGIHGEMVLCDSQDCDNKNERGQPWYICKHGNDTSEYMCGACELDD